MCGPYLHLDLTKKKSDIYGTTGNVKKADFDDIVLFFLKK